MFSLKSRLGFPKLFRIYESFCVFEFGSVQGAQDEIEDLSSRLDFEISHLMFTAFRRFTAANQFSFS